LFTTLKKNWEFKRVKLEGQWYSCAAFIVEVCPPLNPEQTESRVGFVASKRLGNAIKRNYAKRRLRALWAKVIPTLKTPRDYVLIAKPALLTNLFAQLEQDLYKVLRKIEQHEDKV
jgi:ribonuclease P protein component